MAIQGNVEVLKKDDGSVIFPVTLTEAIKDSGTDKTLKQVMSEFEASVGSELAQKVSKTGDNIAGNLILNNTVGLQGKKIDGNAVNIGRVGGNVVELGSLPIPTTLYGTVLSYNSPTLGVKEIALKTMPAETVITSGLASGWSGEIRLRKNQEGLINVYVNLIKNIDVVAGETIANIPIGFRPAINNLTATILCNSIGSPINNSTCFVLITATGDLTLLTPSGMSTVNARNISSFRTDYY